MRHIPDIHKLSNQEKHNLIRLLWSTVKKQEKQIEQLNRKVEGLEDRLAKNSSKPPTTEVFDKPSPKSRRHSNGKKKRIGGQRGHPGVTLKRTKNPDVITDYDPACCKSCKTSLANESRLKFDNRQAIDLPPLDLIVTEHRAHKKRCGKCGVVNKAEFPKDIKYAVQYGPKIKGLMVYMHHYQLLPFDRNRQFFEDIFKQKLSVATIQLAASHAFERLEKSEEHTKEILANEPLLHADETGFRVNKTIHWMHVASTKKLTHYGAHIKRGKEAVEKINILPKFKGVLVHDHLKSYFQYGNHNALCNAHHLRELTFIQERYKHKWAEKMEGLLIRIKTAVEAHFKQTGDPLPKERQQFYWTRYTNILYDGMRDECPRKPKLKKGPVGQTKARNLLERLRRFDKSTLAFMYNPSIPFDNNQAERDIRMMKVQQKISGCFRSGAGIERFCRIRGYISTARKQGISILTALQKAMQDQAILFDA